MPNQINKLSKDDRYKIRDMAKTKSIPDITNHFEGKFSYGQIYHFITTNKIETGVYKNQHGIQVHRKEHKKNKSGMFDISNYKNLII